MRESSRQSPDVEAKILCIEVLISRTYIRDSNQNLFWTLSVYSLENHPVKSNRSFHNSDLFHFMAYDWERTVKKLLEDRQIPYSVVQYFAPESIHTESDQAAGVDATEEKILSAINDLYGSYQSSSMAIVASDELLFAKLP